MSETTLEEHEARVERAQAALGHDLQSLARWGRVGKGKLILFLGGAALLGVVLVRAAYRKPKFVVGTSMRRSSPSLVSMLLRMAVLEGARVALTRLAPRLSGALEPGPAVPPREAPALMPERVHPKASRED
jgi:hypothetical protein